MIIITSNSVFILNINNFLKKSILKLMVNTINNHCHISKVIHVISQFVIQFDIFAALQLIRNKNAYFQTNLTLCTSSKYIHKYILKTNNLILGSTEILV